MLNLCAMCVEKNKGKYGYIPKGYHLNEKNHWEISELWKKGTPTNKIGNKFGIGQRRIQQIIFAINNKDNFWGRSK